MWYLETYNLISNLQHGFRKNNSSLNSLAIIENKIKETFNKNQYLVLVNLDLQKAFDTIWWHRLIKYMKQLNLKGNIINFIINYLTNRTIQVSNNGTLSSPFILENGSPQGSSLSSTLFLMTINDLPSIIRSTNKITMYADDNIFCKGNNLLTII
jgi:hypothetical protein